MWKLRRNYLNFMLFFNFVLFFFGPVEYANNCARCLFTFVLDWNYTCMSFCILNWTEIYILMCVLVYSPAANQMCALFINCLIYRSNDIRGSHFVLDLFLILLWLHTLQRPESNRFIDPSEVIFQSCIGQHFVVVHSSATFHSAVAGCRGNFFLSRTKFCF